LNYRFESMNNGSTTVIRGKGYTESVSIGI
jgi:hypothetical protein